MPGKIKRYEASISGAPRLAPLRRSQNSVSIITGLICLLVGLVVGASLVALPVAAAAYALTTTWEREDLAIVKKQDIPYTEKEFGDKKSEVVIPLE